MLQRKRYETRRFHNPYFAHLPKRNWKAIFLLLAGALIAVAAIGWLFGSPRFAISSIVVTGNETIPSEQISARVSDELSRRRFLVFRSGNRFLFNEACLREALLSAYAFETLDIVRTCELMNDGGCAVQISVKEKTSQLLWRSEERVFLADLQGIVIRELTTQEMNDWNAKEEPSQEPLPDGTMTPVPAPSPLKRLPTFTDVNATPVSIGTNVLSSEEVAKIFMFHQRISELGITFATTKIDRLAGKWMAVQTVMGYDILFDAAGDVLTQAKNLEILLRDTVKDPSQLRYIDLRFGDHVYYK